MEINFKDVSFLTKINKKVMQNIFPANLIDYLISCCDVPGLTTIMYVVPAVFDEWRDHCNERESKHDV